jgi:hypothetical protein
VEQQGLERDLSITGKAIKKIKRNVGIKQNQDLLTRLTSLGDVRPPLPKNAQEWGRGRGASPRVSWSCSPSSQTFNPWDAGHALLLCGSIS